MKTLYISDLDGTLLNKNAEISEFTKSTLIHLIGNGLNFSVATARTSETVLHILNEIPISIPIILMNGVIIHDSVNRSNIKTHFIETESLSNLIISMKKHKITGFLYFIENGRVSTYYEDLYSEQSKGFVEERIRKYGKKFTQVDDFADLEGKSSIYFSVCEKRETIYPLFLEICEDKNLHTELYRDIYNDGFWYMEVCSGYASKHNALNYVREKYGFDRIVSFGDNLNDLPLFLGSDECYAVANAKPEVIAKADRVIDSNVDDGVARWLLENSGF
ncbi:MAG: HAD-IIB family hydrolase [Saccharofermentanales bacterium]